MKAGLPEKQRRDICAAPNVSSWDFKLCPILINPEQKRLRREELVTAKPWFAMERTLSVWLEEVRTA